MSINAVRGRTRYPGTIDPRLLAPVLIPKANLALWLAADSMTLADGALISSWQDISGNNNHATQATDTSKPTFKTNILKGKPIIRFDGGDSLNLASAIGASPCSIYFVLKPSQISAGTIIAGNAAGAFQIRFSSLGKIDLLKSGVAVFATSTTILSTTNYSFLTVTYSNPNYTFRLNGAADGSGSSAQTMNGVNRIAINYDGGNYNGDIAELIVYNAVLSDTDRDTVESYLKTKYGL